MSATDVRPTSLWQLREPNQVSFNHAMAWRRMEALCSKASCSFGSSGSGMVPSRPGRLLNAAGQG
jgi:hypothetical protein